MSPDRVITESRQNAGPPNPDIMGGSNRIELDTLVLSLAINSTDSDIFPHLKEIKSRLQESDHLTDERVAFLSDGGNRLVFNLQRVGVRMFPYVLKSGDITLFLSERSVDSPIPSGRLQIGSISCQNGVQTIYQNVKDWLQIYGIRVVHDKVSRVDLCADMLDTSITDPETQLYNEDYWVSKARSSAVYRENRKITGVQAGKGKISMRIYNKVLELAKPHNSHKLEFFQKKWGKAVDSCTRVEFQLRRDAINEFLKHGDFKDLLNNLSGIWQYLTHDWFRHSKTVVDRKNRHQDRIICSKFWQAVQNKSCRKDYCSRFKKVTIHKSVSMLRAQVRGILTTLCAGYGHEKEDYFGVMNTVANIAQEEMKKAMDGTKEWYKLFETRQQNTILLYDEPKPEPEKIFDEKMFNAKQLMLEFNPSILGRKYRAMFAS